MEKALHDLLTEKLADTKHGDKALVKIVEDWEDAASVKGKVQTANEEISKERDELKGKVKEANNKLADKDKEIERLQDNMLSDEDKKNFEDYKKRGMTSDKEKEMDAKLNAMADKLEQATAKITEMTQTIEEKESAALKATEESAKTSLKTDVIGALAKHGVKSPNAQKLAINSILADGLARVVKDENGGFKRVFTVVKDGKSLEATIEQLAETFAKENEALVDSSGKSGSGTDHSSYDVTTGLDYAKATAADIDDFALQNL